MPQKLYARLAGAVLALLAAAPGVSFAEAAGQWKSGQQMYAQTCAFCHSAAVGPNLFGRELAPEYVKYVVLHGLRAMPAFRPTDFNANDLELLAIWIRDSKAPPAPSAAAPAAQPASTTAPAEKK